MLRPEIKNKLVDLGYKVNETRDSDGWEVTVTTADGRAIEWYCQGEYGDGQTVVDILWIVDSNIQSPTNKKEYKSLLNLYHSTH